ncbi:MAG: nickel pincer cofactor biosynthesis protein LarC [Gemmatimonadaceae bacterium]|nr:nickel pincer cofactor biosynthesis protein LarC [Gemmatimonadaceae bacterium]
MEPLISAPVQAILDPFSGISGDMTLGALVDVGLSSGWLESLPARLGLGGVGVRIAKVSRGGIAATKVDFDIPEQPHGRHIDEILKLVEAARLPAGVASRAGAAFRAIAEIEGEAHGVPADRVHLHEVGAVDAILDVVGGIWGFEQLGVTRVTCGTISLGDGFVRAAHGVLPVPAPATMRLLEGQRVRPGPEGTGELVTPTGAALVRVLAEGPPPVAFVPRRAGFGAGTRDLLGRPNVLRIILADTDRGSATQEHLVVLACDLDDMTAEGLSGAAQELLNAGALDAVLIATHMKKGRPGTRLEVLCAPGDVSLLESLVFRHTTTLGVRRWPVERTSLRREVREVVVGSHTVRVKIATLPNGERRCKAEFDDVLAVARATGRTASDVARAALAAAER